MTVDLLSTTQLAPPHGGEFHPDMVDVSNLGLEQKDRVLDLKVPVVDEKAQMGESQIKKLFAGSAILVTGGTGFLGKLLVEKLLRSCSDLRKVFMLARPKKDKDPAQRLQEQFDDVLYDRLRKEQPDFMQKIHIIEGDVGQLELGISADDRATLMNEVDVIFHGAATVRFDEPLRSAVRINVRGTRELLRLARACARLRALLHISTAYSNCTLHEIEERFYESPLAGDKLIDLVETMDQGVLDSITPGLLGDFPNTYAYTKAVAEDIVLKYSKGLPVALFRPSIVIGTAKEPVAGWIDNVYGPTGVVVGAAVGLLHALHCAPGARADLVPGDVVVGGLVAAAWRLARDLPAPGNQAAPPPDLPPPVYHCVSGEQKPITWEKFMQYNEVYGLQVPTVQAVYYYVFRLTASRARFALYAALLHWLPAYLVDGVAVLVGKKPMLRKTYKKIAKFSEVMAYFATREWRFHDGNTRKLFSELCEADKRDFNFDLSSFDWEKYFYNYVRGIRLYLLKDPNETVPQGLIKHNRLKLLHYFFCSVLGLILLRLLWAIFGSILGF